MSWDSKAVCCCATHSVEFVLLWKNTRKHVPNQNLILHSSVGSRDSSDHTDPGIEDMVDIYSVVITDKAELRGEDGRMKSVMRLRVWSLKTFKWMKPRPKWWWENKNPDIMFKKLWTSEMKRGTEPKLWSQSENWKRTKRQTQTAWDGFMWPGETDTLKSERDVIGCWTGVGLVRVALATLEMTCAKFILTSFTDLQWHY